MVSYLSSIPCLPFSSSDGLLHCHLWLCTFFWGEISERGVNNIFNLTLVFNLLLSTFISHHHLQKTLEPSILLVKVVSVLCPFS